MDARPLARFLSSVRHHPLFALWWLAALRGLRRGELCALRWPDLDLHDGTLSVGRNFAHERGRPYLDVPKTDAALRTIALDTTTIQVLRRHRDRQRFLCKGAGRSWEVGGYVFARPDGRPIRPDWLTHVFAQLAAEAGLPPVRLHGLRHGAATLALSAHVELKNVQQMLGHTSYAFTADTYATVLPEDAKKAAESTAQLLLDALARLPQPPQDGTDPGNDLPLAG